MEVAQDVSSLTHKLPKINRLEARINDDQKYLFQQAANLLGRSLTDFVVNTLQEAALRIVREHEILGLTGRDRKIFIQALIKAPTPNKALRNAATRYKKEIKMAR
ncbi:MAG: hypothetical protein A2103_02420 [Gammaproteobacteria bacterium GWF2_41_13]|nr:MAG: hypothetical protein A2103_02420 [Gammaproteobacteria bacterium GWF2_41_13]